ncbi:MAG TPA: lysophospholipid acyltransferase family protein [Polyangiaceae bacterium]|jgi:KDO2-lipid IV(A) lauroyltransferase|nr:lysophospholipid acyltransferase family protein [Polyangiaceae bacterium]
MSASVGDHADSRAAFSLDGSFWRRAARWGARGPEWFVRVTPPVVGVVVCALAPAPRKAIADNLRRIRGSRGALRDAADVARTFATYAACLTEVLGGQPPRSHAVIKGELHMEDAIAEGKGIVVVTAHTAGWEVVGPLLARDRHLDMTIVEAAEPDAAASAIQDEARRAMGIRVAHVGDDPLSALPLAKHLRGGGVVALQIDRTPPGLRTRAVTLFGQPAGVPEGPLRLASLTGAPIVPVFVARTGHRRYEIVASAPIRLDREPSEAALDAAAQEMASRLEAFVRAHPTQWFHFRSA